jgi:CP family cyanate transporter-like MFS transporter
VTNPDAPGSESRGPRLAPLVVLFVVALALRPQLVGAATLIGSIQADLGLSHTLAGIATTIPVLCMGIFALVTPAVTARIGTHRTLAVSLAFIAIAGLARSASTSAFAFILLTVAIGIGIGIGGAVLPVIVRAMTPDRPVGGTAAYASGLQLGSAASAAAAAPLAGAVGGWGGALAVISAATLLPLAVWFGARPLGPRLPAGPAPARATFDRTALALAAVFGLFGTVYYGMIAWLPDAYIERGWDQAGAGAIIAVLNVGSLVGALSIALIAARLGYGRAVGIMSAGFAIAVIGFATVADGSFAWAALAGYANGALFPLLLAEPLRRATSSAQVAQFSAVMLGGGYSLAAIGPVILGAARDRTGTFGFGLTMLAAAAIVLAVLIAGIHRAAPDNERDRPRR